MVGWAIGRWIDEVTGFGDAMVKMAKKMGVARVAAEQEAATRAKLVAAFGAESAERAKYDELVANGIPVHQAAILAAREENELAYLQAKATELTAKQLDRLEFLEAKFPDLARKSGQAMSEAAQSAEDRKKALKDAEEAEQQYGETVKAVALDLIKARKDEAEADAETLKRELDDRMASLNKYAKAELALWKDAEEKKKRLLAGPNAARVNKDQLAAVEKELAKHAANLQGIGQQRLSAEEAYNLKLSLAYQKRVSDIKAKGQEEVAAARKASDEVIGIYRDAAQKADSEIASIRAKQDAGTSAAVGFIQQQQQAELQRRDSVQADIADLTRQASAAMLAARADAERVKILDIYEKRARELAQASDLTGSIQEAQAKLAGVREKIKAEMSGTGSRDDKRPERIAALRAEGAQAEQVLNDLMAKVNERKAQAEKGVALLREQKEDSMADEHDEEKRVSDLEAEKTAAQAAIATEQAAQETAVAKIVAKQNEVVASLDGQIARYRTLLELQGALASGRGGPPPPTPGAGAPAAGQTPGQENAGGNAVTDWLRGLAGAGKTQGGGETGAAGGISQDLAAMVKSVAASLDTVSLNQERYLDTVSSLGETFYSKLVVIAESLGVHRAELQLLAARINALDVSGNAEDRLAAQGY
jgi:hypothetical protein